MSGCDWACSALARSGRLRRTPDFGLDAPPIVFGYASLGLLGVVLLVVAGYSVMAGWGVWAVVLGFGVSGLMTYSSKIGKVRVRDRLLGRLRLRGVEAVLYLGCGSGLMLLGVRRPRLWADPPAMSPPSSEHPPRAHTFRHGASIGPQP